MKKVLLIFVFTALNTFSQPISWSVVTSSYASLPDGVNLLYGERSSPALRIWYFDVDMNRPDLGIKAYKSASGRQGLTSFLSSYGAAAGINGGYFDMQTGASYSALVTNETVAARNIASVVRDSKTYFLTRGFFGVTDTREMSVDWIYHYGSNIKDIYKFEQPIQNAQGTPGPVPNPSAGTAYYELVTGIGGGPVLVKNGQKNITYTEEVFWGSGVGLTNQDPRTAVGFTPDNHAILLAADGRQTASSGLSLNELADIMISLGCVEAMNLDGGGSTQIAAGTTLINLPEGQTYQRPIPTMLAVVQNDSVPYLPPVFYRKVIDTGDEQVSLTGSWSTSGIGGYWGSTPSLRAPKGNGESYAEFKVQLPAPGNYAVYGWWTAAADRCTDTPFIINHMGISDTVRVDQTGGRYKWNLIGTYAFAGSGDESVVVSNSAISPGYVVADAVRLLVFDSIAVDVKELKDAPPGSFLLRQNFPNPFNPETVITYSIPEAAFVDLTVFNILGSEAAVLVNDVLPAGRHSVTFNASDLPSGIYFYRLRAGSYSEIKKMCLLK